MAGETRVFTLPARPVCGDGDAGAFCRPVHETQRRRAAGVGRWSFTTTCARRARTPEQRLRIVGVMEGSTARTASNERRRRGACAVERGDGVAVPGRAGTSALRGQVRAQDPMRAARRPSRSPREDPRAAGKAGGAPPRDAKARQPAWTSWQFVAGRHLYGLSPVLRGRRGARCQAAERRVPRRNASQWRNSRQTGCPRRRDINRRPLAGNWKKLARTGGSPITARVTRAHNQHRVAVVGPPPRHTQTGASP